MKRTWWGGQRRADLSPGSQGNFIASEKCLKGVELKVSIRFLFGTKVLNAVRRDI